MTHKAAKVLALLRQGKPAQDLTVYQYRSLHSLIREGYLTVENCGQKYCDCSLGRECTNHYFYRNLKVVNHDRDARPSG